MPATRSGRKPAGPASLLGHFQATKRSTGSADHALRGRSNAKKPTPARSENQATSLPAAKLPDQSPSTPPPSQIDVARYSTPEPRASTIADAVNDRPSQSRLSQSSSPSLSPSPPPELLGSTDRPVTVREDPDRGKFFLMISPSKRSPAITSASSRSAPGELSRASRHQHHLRQGSPTLDRTPVRHDALPTQPPSAPRKKRRLSQVDFERLRRENEESPLPQDKRRPSFKALGASQESGLSLTGIGRSAGHFGEVSGSGSGSGSDADGNARSTSPALSLSDDDLVITPRKVRERVTGIDPPSFATPTKAARFDNPLSASRPKPTISAGIFSSLLKSSPLIGAGGSRTSRSSSDEDNPFLDDSPTFLQVAASQGMAYPPYALSPGLPLPQHFNTMLLLHSALEHALVVHLATCGTATSSTSSMESTLTDNMGQSIVRLPNLITYSALRPLVERTAGRRLGPVELARLVYIWCNGSVDNAPAVNATTAPTRPSQHQQPDPLAGLGFLLSRQRCLDGNGRRKWDWSLGIELVITRPRRQETPPMQISFGQGAAGVEAPTTPTRRTLPTSGTSSLDTPPSTPPSMTANKRRRETSNSDYHTNASPGSSTGREGMSFVALWNNGIEERKNEVGKRLRGMVAIEMEQWLQTKDAEEPHQAAALDDAMDEDIEHMPRPSTPERPSRSVHINAGGLPTPSATRTEGKRRRVVDFSPSIMQVDEAGRRTQSALSGGPDTHREAVASWSKPGPAGVLTSWHPDFSLKDVKAIPCAVLPSLHEHRESANAQVPVRQSQERDNAASSPAVAVLASGSSSRALSLMDRIKAKEEAASAKRSSMAASVSSSVSGSMTTVKRRATLSRLPELASALYMLYTNSDSNGNKMGRLPTLPLSQVLSTLSKSARVSLSPLEARHALDLLNDLLPGSVDFKLVGGAEWVNLNISANGGLAEVRRKVREELNSSGLSLTS